MLKNLILRQSHLYKNSVLRSPYSSFMLVPKQQRMFGAFVNHRDTADNLEESPFEFTEENYEKVRIQLAKFPDNYKHSAVIPVLFIAQKQNDNFLTLSAMNKVAKILEMEPM